MVSGLFWVWDGRGFVPRSLAMHHHDAYELLDGEIEHPDLAALAEVMAINSACHTILAPNFASWGDGTDDGPRKWVGGWTGTYFRPIRTAVIGLCGGYHTQILAHELCHSIAEALGDALTADDSAMRALDAWLGELGLWPEPPQLVDDPKQWEIVEERLCYSYDAWHVGADQPHGLALPRQVERIYRGIKSGKVWRRYMS